MSKITFKRFLSFTIIYLMATMLIVNNACDKQDKIEKERFYGAWVPCMDEKCEVLSDYGIAFSSEDWFYQFDYITSNDSFKKELKFSKKECCWNVHDDYINVDFGKYFHEIYGRFADEDQFQIELLKKVYIDEENNEIIKEKCYENEDFQDAGLKEGDNDDDFDDISPKEQCWSKHWMPIGKLTRVLPDKELAKILDELNSQ